MWIGTNFEHVDFKRNISKTIDLIKNVTLWIFQNAKIIDNKTNFENFDFKLKK